MAEPEPLGLDPRTGPAADSTLLFPMLERQWDNTEKQWKEATSEIGRVKKAAQESLEHARKNHPEHLPTVQRGADQAEKETFEAVTDFLDTLRIRQFNLEQAWINRRAPATGTQLADIVSNDRVAEELSQRRLQERLAEAMRKARPAWLFAPRNRALLGPRVPKTPKAARPTVRAKAARERRAGTKNGGRAR